jgi:hypothetical protein
MLVVGGIQTLKKFFIEQWQCSHDIFHEPSVLV